MLPQRSARARFTVIAVASYPHVAYRCRSAEVALGHSTTGVRPWPHIFAPGSSFMIFSQNQPLLRRLEEYFSFFVVEDKGRFGSGFGCPSLFDFRFSMPKRRAHRLISVEER